VDRIELHHNRTVMLSWGNRTLRIHQGYAMAPDRVLQAIVRFMKPRIPRKLRKALEHHFLSFPVDLHAPSRPERTRKPERPRPGDLRLLHELAGAHERLNGHYFGGTLRPIHFRLSSRMKTRLGDFSVNIRTGEPIAITLSRSHLRNDPWSEVEHTVLHEMVHQWQVENSLPLDHGPHFRRKAREVGIQPSARRHLTGKAS
jgi:SprT-like family